MKEYKEKKRRLTLSHVFSVGGTSILLVKNSSQINEIKTNKPLILDLEREGPSRWFELLKNNWKILKKLISH